MKVDAFMAAAGMCQIGDELSPEGRSVLRELAENAFRAGVRPTVQDWLGWNAETQAAWRAAGDKVRREDAVLVGIIAYGGPTTAAKALEEDDGGRTLRRSMVSRAADAAAAEAGQAKGDVA